MTASVQSPGEMIRYMQDSVGLSNEELGDMLGTSRHKVHMWACGGSVSVSQAVAIARLFSEVTSPEQSSRRQVHDLDG